MSSIKLLVLGGTRHVGREVAEAAVQRGDDGDKGDQRAETVTDTRQWPQAEGYPEPPAGRAAMGRDPGLEQQVLGGRR